MSESIEELIRKVEALRAEGKIPAGVTREERVSWVYGNCKLSNPLVTREMVEAAVDGVSEKQALYIQPMTARDAAFAEGRMRGREEGLLYAIHQVDLMAEGQRGKVARIMSTSQCYQDAADRLRVRLRAGMPAASPKAGEP